MKCQSYEIIIQETGSSSTGKTKFLLWVTHVSSSCYNTYNICLTGEFCGQKIVWTVPSLLTDPSYSARDMHFVPWSFLGRNSWRFGSTRNIRTSNSMHRKWAWKPVQGCPWNCCMQMAVFLKKKESKLHFLKQLVNTAVYYYYYYYYYYYVFALFSRLLMLTLIFLGIIIHFLLLCILSYFVFCSFNYFCIFLCNRANFVICLCAVKFARK
jgi:hypothetical protein